MARARRSFGDGALAGAQLAARAASAPGAGGIGRRSRIFLQLARAIPYSTKFSTSKVDDGGEVPPCRFRVAFREPQLADVEQRFGEPFRVRHRRDAVLADQLARGLLRSSSPRSVSRIWAGHACRSGGQCPSSFAVAGSRGSSGLRTPARRCASQR